MLADLNRLKLTLPDPEPQPPANPRSLPAGKIMLSDLSIGRMRLGEVRARYEKTAGGLAVNWFSTESPAFSSQGSAAWLVTDDAGAEQLGGSTWSWRVPTSPRPWNSWATRAASPAIGAG